MALADLSIAALLAGVSRLAGWRVVVVGDVSLDEYLFGRATRLSREAPVPVLELVRREVILGGAANPARNIVALGSSALQIGVVGIDPEGNQLRDSMIHERIDPAGLMNVASRPTTLKTRILSHEPPRLPQQLARLDRLDRSPLQPEEEQRILGVLAEHIPYAHAVLCSDYQLGLLTPKVVETVRSLCRRHGVAMTIDAQGNSHYYHDVDLFRCNDIEAAMALGRPLRSESDFRYGLEELVSHLRARLVIVTRGPDGVSLCGSEVAYTRLLAFNVSEVYDTTGAGDTFIAVATLALAAGITPLTAAQLANIAAALVVRKFGNGVVTPEELSQAVSSSVFRGEE